MDYIYVTFANDGYESKWFILCDKSGEPILSFREAKKYLSENYPDQHWGMSDREQMLLNNAMQDNF